MNAAVWLQKDVAMATSKYLTVGEFKKMVAAIDEEHDSKELWFAEVMGWADHFEIHEDSERGVTIFGERG